MAVPGIRSSTLQGVRSPTEPKHPASPLSALFGPLSQLLRSGGDTRLETTRGTSKYGCRAIPEPNAIALGSSTASSISERGYDAADVARERLLESAIVRGLEPAFEARIEHLRSALLTCLGLETTGTEIVLSPSGTDSQLQALFLAHALLGKRLTTVVVGAGQTGSGTTHTARGRHFSARTALGIPVETGAPIAGLSEHASSTEIALFEDSGAERSADRVDALVTEAVERAVAAGNHVLLQSMDSSKLGRRAPSSECIRRIRACFQREVQIVVDACQLRLGRTHLREHLDQGSMVLITGSKFFSGPAFSGALLVPQALSARLKNVFCAAGGLFAYSTRYDWPAEWPAIRAHFSPLPNFGQWLRWEAALAEMRTYFAVPASFRRAALLRFAADVPEMIAASPCLELLPAQMRFGDASDDEMAPPTIFPFLVRTAGRLATLEEATRLYRALGSDVSHLLADNAQDAAQLAAAQSCRIGQPVRVIRNGAETAALRISASARFVSGAWSPDGEIARRNITRALEGVATVITKIGLILPHLHSAELEPTA